MHQLEFCIPSASSPSASTSVSHVSSCSAVPFAPSLCCRSNSSFPRAYLDMSKKTCVGCGKQASTPLSVPVYAQPVLKLLADMGHIRSILCHRCKKILDECQ